MTLHRQGSWNEHEAGEQGYEDCYLCKREAGTPEPSSTASEKCAGCGGFPALADNHCVDCIRSLEASQEPAAPPIQEGGGWTRRGEEGDYALWMDEDRQALVPLAVEQVIAHMFALEQYDLLKGRAERAEAERDYLRSVVEELHRDTHDALSVTGAHPALTGRSPMEGSRDD